MTVFSVDLMINRKPPWENYIGRMAVKLDLCFQCQVTGVSGQSGLLAPGPVGQSWFPATGAVAVLSPRLEEQPVLENRKYTVGSEFKSRDSPALSSPSVQVRHHHLVTEKIL